MERGLVVARTKVYFPTEIKCYKNGLKAIYEVSAEENSKDLWDVYYNPNKKMRKQYGTLICPNCQETKTKRLHNEMYCSYKCRVIYTNKRKKRENDKA